MNLKQVKDRIDKHFEEATPEELTEWLVKHRAKQKNKFWQGLDKEVKKRKGWK